jgi:outer membrane lipoprotein SlyB
VAEAACWRQSAAACWAPWQALEITVRLDNGETRVIAQEADVAISTGQRVRLISGNGPTRVVPM